LSEEDGYYSYFGVAPGNYYARIDTAQLRKLSMTSSPDSIAFTVKADLDGDYIEGLDFVLKKIISETPPEETVTQTVVKKDTSYLILHEEVRELVTITEDYWAMQLGAFKTKSYAEAWMKRIAAVVDKDVELINEDGFYKVRVTGFKNREELDSYIPALQNAGFTEIWIIHNKAKIVERIVTRQDSIARITETAVERPLPVVVPGTVIQVAAFRTQEEASAIIDRLLAAVENLITVRIEDGVYKVQLADIQDTVEIQKLIPILEEKGFRSIVLISPQGTELAPVTGAQADIPVADTAKAIIEKQPEEVVKEAESLPAVPGFVLHAARFYKRSQAERAKNRIIRKLGLPAEIIQEWDSYRVVVTGFFTREETFKYYPELAGLGFTEVYVMELPPQERK
ncbi:MAG: SPOR domain-containing protein, partial [Bacteroidia bacterium]